MARSRKELEHDNIAMNEKRNLEAAKELIQREAKIKEKMRKAEVNVSALKLDLGYYRLFIRRRTRRESKKKFEFEKIWNWRKERKKA